MRPFVRQTGQRGVCSGWHFVEQGHDVDGVELFQIQHQIKAVLLDGDEVTPLEILVNLPGNVLAVEFVADGVGKLSRAAAAIAPIEAVGRMADVFQAFGVAQGFAVEPDFAVAAVRHFGSVAFQFCGVFHDEKKLNGEF